MKESLWRNWGIRLSKCETCCHYKAEHETENHSWGICKRHAPVYETYENGAGPTAKWPDVDGTCWCGDYKPNSTVKKPPNTHLPIRCVSAVMMKKMTAVEAEELVKVMKAVRSDFE